MGGDSTTNTVTKQDNTPWTPAQGYLTDIYSHAQDAYNATSKDPYSGSYIAPQSAATILAQAFGTQLAGKQMGQGNGIISDASSVYDQIMQQLSKNGSWNPTQTNLTSVGYNPSTYDYQPGDVNYNGTGSTYQPTAANFTGTGFGYTPNKVNYTGTDSTYMPTDVGYGGVGSNYTPTAASYDPTGLYNYQSLNFDPMSTSVNDYGTGSDYMKQVLAGAGAAPSNGNPDMLNAAITSAINPVYRQLVEKILPQAKLNAVGSGVYGGDANALDIADQVNTRYTQQAQDIASQLGYQDYTRQAEDAQKIYGQTLGISADSANSAYTRMLQDYMNAQGLKGQQNAQKNSIGADMTKLGEQQSEFGTQTQLNNNSQAFDASKYATDTTNANSQFLSNLLMQLNSQKQTANEFNVNTANQNAQTGANIDLQNNQQGFDAAAKATDVANANAQTGANIQLQNNTQAADANKYNTDTANSNAQFQANLMKAMQDQLMQNAQFKTQTQQTNAQGQMAAQTTNNQQNMDANNAFNQQMLQLIQTQPALAKAAMDALSGKASAIQTGNQLNQDPINALQSIGQSQDAYAQDNVKALYQQWLDQLNAPWQGLDQYQKAIAGYPTSSSGSSTGTTSGGGLF